MKITPTYEQCKRLVEIGCVVEDSVMCNVAPVPPSSPPSSYLELRSWLDPPGLGATPAPTLEELVAWITSSGWRLILEFTDDCQTNATATAGNGAGGCVGTSDVQRPALDTIIELIEKILEAEK